MKRPAFQFYPADWRKDVELQSCSMAAQGLWINAMCLAHECEPYGHLTINGKAMTPAQLGRQVGLSAKESEALIEELLDAGVARKTEEGVVYSSRMVRDEDLRNRRADGGKAGSEFGQLGKEHGTKGGRPKNSTGDKKPPLYPPPSSSSSSSPSGEIQGATAPLSPAQPATAESGLELTGDAGPPSIPPCPLQQLVGLFVAKVPELPKPRLELWKDSKGADAMRQRWKWLLSPDAKREDGSRYATTAADAVEWFGRFFETVHESEFLSGRNGAWKNCDLTWLMNKENFMKVVQGNYNKETA